MSKRSEQGLERKPWKLLIWTAFAGLVFGLLGIGVIVDDWLRVVRNSFHMHKASGQVVFVAIDDKALHELGNWPWPRKVDAQLTDRLTALGAKRIYFDINFSFPSSDRGQDQAFADALERSGRVTLAARAKTGVKGTIVNDGPLPMFARHAKVGLISAEYNYQNAAWQLPYALKLGGKDVPSMASSIAGVSGPEGSSFPVDYSIQLPTIPQYSAADIMSGKVPAKLLAGRDVVVGTATDAVGDQVFVPCYGRGFGSQVHIMGAETLKQGRPVDLGWLPSLLAGIVAAAAMLLRRRFA